KLVSPFSRDKQKITAALNSIGRTNEGFQTSNERARTIASIAEHADQIATLSRGDQASQVLAQMAVVEMRTLEAEMHMQSTFQTRVLFRALRAIAQAAGTLPGRKNVVLFSEG